MTSLIKRKPLTKFNIHALEKVLRTLAKQENFLNLTRQLQKTYTNTILGGITDLLSVRSGSMQTCPLHLLIGIVLRVLGSEIQQQ